MEQYREYISGGYTWRDGVRNGEFVWDRIIGPLGWGGVEDVDWENVSSIV